MKMIHALMSRVKKERDGKMKERYDETHKDVRYEVGDKVLAFKPAVVVGSRKLAGHQLARALRGHARYRTELLPHSLVRTRGLG
jgi:hypothetical protein